MAVSNEEAEKLTAPRDPATKDFIMQQTMLRVRDPRASLDFYTRILGMRLLKKVDIEAGKFSVYFVGYEDEAEIPRDESERQQWALSRKATVELTHNWGTENDPSLKHHNGNSDPRGFGHIGIMVPDVYAACERFEKLGVKFQKKPDDGMMKGLAFILDPDGYWIEIFNSATVPTKK